MMGRLCKTLKRLIWCAFIVATFGIQACSDEHLDQRSDEPKSEDSPEMDGQKSFAPARTYCYWDVNSGSYTCHDFANDGLENAQGTFLCDQSPNAPWGNHSINWIDYGGLGMCLIEPQNNNDCCFQGQPTPDNAEFTACATQLCIGQFNPKTYTFVDPGAKIPTVNDACINPPNGLTCDQCCAAVYNDLVRWCGTTPDKFGCDVLPNFLTTCQEQQCGYSSLLCE